MSKIKPTNEQVDAINNEYPGNFLVGASAGSGKTMVLVQRVIKWLELSQPENELRTVHDPKVRSQKFKQIQKSTSPTKEIYPNNINHLLIVTFTRAAAKEMQSRLQDEISQRIISLRQAHPSTARNQLINHLYRQLREVPVSDIGTLDAFCQKIVTRYYYIIKIDPQFRILTDSAEVEMMRDSVWNKLREEFYTHDKYFGHLVRNFDSQTKSDDNLTSLIYDVYNYSRAKANPNQWLASLTKAYTMGSSLTKSYFYQHYLYQSIYQILNKAVQQIKWAYNVAQDGQISREANQLAENYGAINELLNSLKATHNEKKPENHDQNWNQIYNTLRTYRFGSFPRVRKTKYTDAQQDAHAQAKKYRDRSKKTLKRVQKFFTQDARTNLSLMKQAQNLINELVKVVKAFSERYWELKAQRHAFEFSDIEHMALNILNSKSQESKDVKKQLREFYDEILVDECQDNNELQNKILTTIAKHAKQYANNLFLVGDPKQSIYRFRLADPEWFRNKQKQYAQPSDQYNHLRRLTYNFRSTKNVDAFVNLIFNQIMNNYYPHGQLRFKATYYNSVEKQVNVPVQMMIYDSSTRPNSINSSKAPDKFKGHLNPQFELEDGAHGQIIMIAKKIKTLLSHHVKIYDDKAPSKVRDIEPKDIALISATRNDNLIITNIFKENGIPVTLDGTQNYFKTTEIQIMMSLLQIIDNPYQDIPLVAVLRSPIVGLNENQLAYLRINAKTGDYYHAVTSFAQHDFRHLTKYGANLQKIIIDFLNQLERFRNVAKQHSLVDLIWVIYQKTGFLDYVGGMPNGKQRQANLHALYDRAAEYEQSNFRGLFQFINFIHRMQDKNDDLAEAQDNQSSNAVSVITIHGSKGLQYPVVFLYDVSHHFNQSDINKPYIINKMGLGISCFQPRSYTSLEPLQSQLIKEHEIIKSLAEEQRKLYVALTRTEQRLYIAGTTRNKPRVKLTETWQKNAKPNLNPSNTPLLNESSRKKASCYLDWLGAAMYRQTNMTPDENHKNRICYHAKNNAKARFQITFYNFHGIFGNQVIKSPNKEHQHWLKIFRKHAKDYVQNNQPTPTMKKMQNIINFKYPHENSTHEAAYQSVSTLRKAFEDPDDSEMSVYNRNDGKPINQYINSSFATPKFTQQTNQPPKATEVGTATHLVLQMIPLKPNPTLKRIQKLIHKLVNYGMITPQTAKLINQKNILAFFTSSVGQLVLKHPNDYHRETPFSLLVNADQAFTKQEQDNKVDARPNHDKVLVHGIIDGYLHYNHKVILVDYKTDYVDWHHIKESEAKIKQRYHEQLNLYAMALTKALQIPVEAKYLYLLNIHHLVPIK